VLVHARDKRRVRSTVLTEASLLDSAFKEIGPQSCVGMTGNWAGYSWPPAIMLASLMWLFLLEFGVGYCVESTRWWVYFFRISSGLQGL
jgi:hypothetical protein